MSKTRMEAFSDGVMAVLITILVLELKVPHGSDLHALGKLAPTFCAYALSFVYLGIYWNNHHHMLHMVEHVNGKILWANLGLLFSLSLVPFSTGWMGESHLAPWPTALYGTVLFCAGVAYLILQTAIVAHQGPRSRLAAAIGRDLKGKLSAGLYIAAIALSFVATWVAAVIYVAVALMWLIPDRRIESVLAIHDRAP
jgi:uncharacterized membrane protein